MDLELLVVDYVCNWLGDYSKYSMVSPQFATLCDMVTRSDSRGMGIPLAVNIKVQPWNDRENYVRLCTRAVWRFGAGPAPNISWVELPTGGRCADSRSLHAARPRQHSMQQTDT